MYWDVKTVRPLSDYRLYVEIEDGRKGIFNMKPYLNRGMFNELENVGYFNQVGVVFGAVTWPNEQDIAPETLLGDTISDLRKYRQDLLVLTQAALRGDTGELLLHGLAGNQYPQAF